MTPLKSITIRKPDDWHCHLRDGDFLSRTVADTAAQFHRALVMPNLATPVTTVQQAKAYKQRIEQQIPTANSFHPCMTLYLTEQMLPDTLYEAKTSGFIQACKLYPAGATTHSSAGITNLESIYPLLDTLQEIDLVLAIHGESIDPSVDIFDREAVFIDQQLAPLIKQFPKLRIVLEHISTKYAAEFVHQAPQNVAATITAHHLHCNRNAIFQGGIHPDYYCLPILKREQDRQALIKAATSGEACFFLGTDSAPHAQIHKYTSCGCAGIYTAHAAIELYAEIFEQQQALDKLEAFASQYGAEFYNLPLNTQTITLTKQDWTVPSELHFGQEKLVPFQAGNVLSWQVTEPSHLK